MTFEQTRLTQLEESTALARAGLNPDMATWDDATLDRASIALDEAQKAKVARLTVHKTPEPAGYTLAEMAADLGAYYDKTPEHAS